jgi:pimeloyl-ACP methyl ester carboxylesterase
MSAPTSTWSPPLPDAAGFDHQVVETPGLRTHVATIGEGDPVLLLHGFPQHWWQWRTVAPLIAARGYRVICPDLRGAGWTVADDPRIDRESRLRDLLALLDVLGIEQAHVVSHDMGVITAMQLSYDHPERVRTAVQLAVPPAFFAFSPRIVPGFRHLPPFIWHRPGTSLRGIFSEAYVAHPMAEATVEAHLAPLRRPEIDEAVRPLTRGMILPEAVRMMRGVYRRRRLTVPTLVVYGRRDRPWTEQVLERICRTPERYADRVEFAYVEDAAHFITDDAPAEVADLALGWFDRAA